MDADKPRYCFLCAVRRKNILATHVITFDDGIVRAYCDKHAELVIYIFDPWGVKAVTQIT